jgi:hypothetical protein
VIVRVRLDRLLGRNVWAGSRRVGRIEEFRAEERTGSWVVTAYVLGRAGLWERLGLGARLLFGNRPRGGYLVPWDKLDLSDPMRPRLTCPVDELDKLDG